MAWTAARSPRQRVTSAGAPEIRRFGLPPPALDRETDGAAVFDSELKPARDGHGQAGHFGDDRAQTAMPLFTPCPRICTLLSPIAARADTGSSKILAGGF